MAQQLKSDWLLFGTIVGMVGTGLVMIERQYLKFIPHAMRAKLAAVKESAGTSIVKL